MLSPKLEEALNNQMNNEFYAEFEYLSMAAYFHTMDLDGIANYFHVQADEEHFHALKIYNFIYNKGGNIKLKAIKAPTVDFKSPIDVFEKALEYEVNVTKLINKLMDEAIKENDHAVNSFLRWYVDEQVEEEALATKSLNRMKITDGKGEGLLILDQEFAGRTFTPPQEN
ncbi:MAG TPA: ferritin [Ignavibacteria bacterium]|nr:ferritin [Ignavibacteria bacterium]